MANRQTPSAWLLRRFDYGAHRPDESWRNRPMFELIDDHSYDCFDGDAAGLCFSGEAAWPVPGFGADLGDDPVFEEEDAA